MAVMEDPNLPERPIRLSSRTRGGIRLSDRLAPKVMALIAEGRSYRWIARDLGISKNTVLAIAKRAQPQPKE